MKTLQSFKDLVFSRRRIAFLVTGLFASFILGLVVKNYGPARGSILNSSNSQQSATVTEEDSGPLPKGLSVKVKEKIVSATDFDNNGAINGGESVQFTFVLNNESENTYTGIILRTSLDSDKFPEVTSARNSSGVTTSNHKYEFPNLVIGPRQTLEIEPQFMTQFSDKSAAHKIALEATTKGGRSITKSNEVSLNVVASTRANSRGNIIVKEIQ